MRKAVALERAELEAEGVKIERRLAPALRRALRKVRAGVSIFELGNAIQARDAKAAMAFFPEAIIRDALAPCARIVEDAAVRGGRVAMKAVAKRG